MRRRIYLGLLPLLVLLVAIGCYAVTLFSQLGGAVDVILRENFRSVVAAQNMKETAERMDSGLFFSLAGEQERGRKMFDENLPEFRRNLEIELGNITLPGEAEAANRLKAVHERYVERAQTFYATPDLAAQRAMYFGEMLPAFTEVKDTAGQILKMNQDNMVKADRDARQLAADSTRYMIIAVLAGLVVAVAFARQLRRFISRPVRDLTAFAKELGEGNLDQVVPVTSQDELGQLADAFNKMATKLRQYRQVTGDEILRARQTTETTFSSLPDPIFVLSPEGKIEFRNPAAARLLYKLDRNELPSPVQAAAEKVLKGSEDYLPETLDRVICVRIDDRETFLLPRIVGMRDGSGVASGAAVILQDVTRFCLLDQVKTNLVSTVSHELKTPLTSVRMGLHLLLEEKIGDLNPKQADLVLAARDDAERLLSMINDLLNLARLESGASKLMLQHVPAVELAENAIQTAKEQAERRGLRVTAEIAPNLPEVMAEAQQIEHVCTNLITNAAKHSRTGEEIIIRARRDGSDAVRFSVIDHGPGIPQQYQSRIFDRFFRVPGSEKTGAGLGLAIAREIIVAHGGQIGVESESNKGATFFFTLPAAEKSATS